MNFTVGAPGTSSSCVNGSGVSLASSTTGFEISTNDISFTGASSSASASGSSAAPSASATAKSGAGFIQVSAILFVAVVGAAVALL